MSILQKIYVCKFYNTVPPPQKRNPSHQDEAMNILACSVRYWFCDVLNGGVCARNLWQTVSGHSIRREDKAIKSTQRHSSDVGK